MIDKAADLANIIADHLADDGATVEINGGYLEVNYDGSTVFMVQVEEKP